MVFKKGSIPWNKGLTKHTNEKLREISKKISLTNTGFKHSEETKKKMSESKKGKNNNFYGVHLYGKDNPNYGRKHTKKSKKQMSETRKRLIKEGKIKIIHKFEKGQIAWNKHTQETKNKVIQLWLNSDLSKLEIEKRLKIGHRPVLNMLKGIIPSDEILSLKIKRQSSLMIKTKVDRKHLYPSRKGKNSPLFGIKRPEISKRMSELHKGKKKTEEHKRKISLAKIKQWKDKEYREKVTKNSLKALFNKRPTSLEKQMIDIINKNNLSYKYTGDGSFLIGYKNPDFINTNGEKICIEVANTFHHKKDYPIKRKEYFKRFGWKCIVFLMNNLYEKKVLEQIANSL